MDQLFTQSAIIYLWRTVDEDYMRNIHGIDRDNISSHIGDILVNKGYMSTAKEMKSPWGGGSHWQPYEFLLHITSNKSYPYIDVN